jgi:hypothetical protein
MVINLEEKVDKLYTERDMAGLAIAVAQAKNILLKDDALVRQRVHVEAAIEGLSAYEEFGLARSLRDDLQHLYTRIYKTGTAPQEEKAPRDEQANRPDLEHLDYR